MSDNIFRRVKNDEGSHPTRYYSSKQENAVAKSTGANTTPNSGATEWVKGDLLDKDTLFECKTVTKHQKSFTLQKEWFEKNKNERLFMGKSYSVVVFNFGPDEENYYIIDEDMFKEYLELKEKILDK